MKDLWDILDLLLGNGFGDFKRDNDYHTMTKQLGKPQDNLESVEQSVSRINLIVT